MEKQMDNLRRSNDAFNNKFKNIDYEIDSIDEEINNINTINEEITKEYNSNELLFRKKSFFNMVDRTIEKYVKKYIYKYIYEYVKKEGSIKIDEDENNRDNNSIGLPEKSTLLNIDEAFLLGVENLKDKKKAECQFSLGEVTEY